MFSLQPSVKYWNFKASHIKKIRGIYYIAVTFSIFCKWIAEDFAFLPCLLLFSFPRCQLCGEELKWITFPMFSVSTGRKMYQTYIVLHT